MHFYHKLLTTNPLATKVVTSGLIGAVSDQMCQSIEGKRREERSWLRTGTLAAIGMIYVAPMLHLHYTFVCPMVLAKVQKFMPLSTPMKQSIVKLGYDQLFFAPFMVSGFFLTASVIENEGLLKGIRDVRQKFWPTLKMNWMIWTPASFLNFWLVPIPYQVLAANWISLVYNIGLSNILNAK